MLSQRLVRAAALRNGTAAARRLPAIQRRTFLPSSFSDKKVYDEKFPDLPKLSAAEDPEMVRGLAIGLETPGFPSD
jgi:NADH dehydrogenase (ubiquinone) 1 beta subcomplex subunit 8